MKKLLLISFSVIIFFVPGCEEEEEGKDSNIIFSIYDNGYMYRENYSVYLHDAANPTDLPIATAFLEKGESAVFTRDSLSELEYAHYVTVDVSDIEKLIVTTCGSDGLSQTTFTCTSNWFVEKGSVWNMMGTTSGFGYGDTILVTIEAPTGQYITTNYTDIGNSYQMLFSSDSSFSNLFWVNSVDTEGKITISSVVEIDDDNWYLGVLEDQDWAPGLEFTIDEWQTGMINPLTVNLTDTDDKDYLIVYSYGTSASYSGYDRRTDWLTSYRWSDEPDTLDGSISVMTTDGIPNTDGTKIYLGLGGSDGTGFSDPNRVYYYSEYNNFQNGDIASPKEMNISFDYSSASGSILNITADDDIDQVRIWFGLEDDSFNYYSWYHYFDPNEGSRFDLPNIDVYDRNMTLTSTRTYIHAEDYDNFDGSADIVKALFEDNNFNTSWTNRHYNIIYGLFDGLLGRQQVNNDPEEFDSQELDMFGIPISPPRFK
jgi:hypothetical protein